MAKLDNLQQLHRLLKGHRRPVPLALLAQRLECSERTVRRLIDEMKTWFDAPIEYDKVHNGWHYANTGDEFEIPGLAILESGRTPPPIDDEKLCRACSLVDLCDPRTFVQDKTLAYVEQIFLGSDESAQAGYT